MNQKTRTPNTTCDLNGCNNEFYARPYQLEEQDNTFCSQECYDRFRSKDPRECPECGNNFIYNHVDQVYCGKRCAALASRGSWDTTEKRKPKTPTERKKNKLLESGMKEQCCVVGCNYSKTLDVHRHIPGKEGGKYEVENMFFLCPNHHAEATRGITEFEKIDDKTLKQK